MKPTDSTAKLYNLSYSEAKTYLLATIFIIGNIAIPQLCHLAALGGPRWLPIYFFTLIAAYKYGWKAGLLTALASPVVNCALFGMPAAAALPAILVKSVSLAFIASVTARKTRQVTIAAISLTVIGYQVIGTAAEWAITGSLETVCQDLIIGYSGLLVQIFGGYLLLRAIRFK